MSPVMPTKKYLKEEIMEAVTQNFMEKILDKVNQKEQDALKKFQDTTDTIKKEIYEIKKTT
jgi:hypothetical protein